MVNSLQNLIVTIPAKFLALARIKARKMLQIKVMVEAVTCQGHALQILAETSDIFAV